MNEAGISYYRDSTREMWIVVSPSMDFGKKRSGAAKKVK